MDFGSNYGVLNSLLGILGITGPNWLYDPDWVLPSYLIMAIWGASGGLYIYLAALKDIPKELYESATIDGAGLIHRIRYITLPMLTPILFYNMVIGIISAFRKFTDAYILGGAGEEGIFIWCICMVRPFPSIKWDMRLLWPGFCL